MQEFKAKVQELIDRYDESLSQNGLKMRNFRDGISKQMFMRDGVLTEKVSKYSTL